MLDKLVPIEREAGHASGSWFLARLMPYWNNGAQRLFGYTVDEAISRPISMLVGDRGEEQARLMDRAAKAPEKEAGTARRESRAADERDHQRKDGSRFRGTGTMMLMRNPAGEAVGFLKIMRDLTRHEPDPG